MKRITSIEKLTDANGVYGYAILGESRLLKPVILRPDRIVPGGRKSSDDPMLQPIPRSFPIKLHRGSTEQQMVGELAASFMTRTSLVRPWDEEWDGNPEARQKQHRHYFAALNRSRRIVDRAPRQA